MRILALSAAVIALPLAACSSTWDGREGDMTADAGAAIRHDINAQLVNPNAPAKHGAFITDGERAYRALERYSKDAVKTPADASTKAGGGNSAETDNSSSDDNSVKTP